MTPGSAPEDARRRWREERQREALTLMWDWDPLGILGVAESCYAPLANAAVETLENGEGAALLSEALKVEVWRLASEGLAKGLLPGAQLLTTSAE